MLLIDIGLSHVRASFRYCNAVHHQSVLFASQASGPIANSADRIIAESARTCVLPANQSVGLHFCTAYKLFALQRMRKVALVKALDVAVAMQNHFHLNEREAAGEGRAIRDLLLLASSATGIPRLLLFIRLNVTTRQLTCARIFPINCSSFSS